MQHNDPLQSGLNFLTNRGWFEPEDDIDNAQRVPPVFIPDNIASQLGLTPEQVNNAHPQIFVNGRLFVVRGIFTAASLNALTDLDGLNLRPMDLEAMSVVNESQTFELSAEDTDPRISAENMVIMPMQNLFDRSGIDFFNISFSNHTALSKISKQAFLFSPSSVSKNLNGSTAPLKPFSGSRTRQIFASTKYTPKCK